MPQAKLDGIDTFWRVIGQGPLPGLAVHCSLAHSGAFEGLGAELSDLLTLTAYDLPGHGGSADWDQSRPYQESACAQGRALLPEAPVHLIGHSFGATVALRLAVEQPERIASLTLIECVFFGVVRRDHPDHPSVTERLNGPFVQLMARGDYTEAARSFHGTWGDGRDWNAMSDRQRDGLIRRMPLIAAVNETNNGDPLNMLAEARLERLKVPTLLIEGAKSPPNIDMIHAGLARRLPQVTRVSIPGAAHMAPITHPAPVAKAIRDFLITNASVPASLPLV
ncbi:alpha/beta hydrolase [Pseudooceanicola sp.]|uniref:alpha/beta fold hydrolase n=1 Tax=Pseudooceanicola sp. TaxID=1914328 RepID=UPI0026394292|nr:alpha/beta hydrolase [Pseudooceanicola sp.]MDF1854459.1 alpha/beta hydrolase [Pseudooceanicola sp.]